MQPWFVLCNEDGLTASHVMKKSWKRRTIEEGVMRGVVRIFDYC